MRQKEAPTTALGRIVWDFRGKFHLSKRAAAEALGVSYVYVNSLEAGVDVRTKLPFEPRESTLESIARRMVEYAEKQGLPLGMTAEQLTSELKAAAGKTPPKEGGAESTVVDLFAGADVTQGERFAVMLPNPPFAPSGPLRKAIMGLRKRYAPTEEEWAIIDELDRTGSWYGGFSQPGFWELPPEERESEFFYLKGLMREHRKREQSK